MTERGDTPYLQLSHEARGRWGEVPWSFRWGGDVRLNTFESTLTVDEELVWNVAAFANGEVVLGRWRLGGGMRVDRESLAGESVSPRLTAVWTPVDGHQLRLAFNTGFNTPSLLTRFAAFPANGLPVVGARGLQPERTIYGELAWAGSFTGWLRGFASVFAYRFEDWISLQPSFPPSDPPAPVPYGNNADAVEVFGGETGLEASPTRLVSGYASYAFIDATGAGEQPYCGVEPHGSPRHKVNAGVRLAHAVGAYLTADVHWVGPSEVARLPNPPETALPPQGCIFLPSSLDAYVTANARLGYTFGGGVDLSIAASNLFGQEVQQFPGGEKPERRVFVTLARVR